jgi:signal transduction histidine kinase
MDPGGPHRFVVHSSARPLLAEADADKLRQVLVNLLDNSVKFSPDGGTIKVDVRRQLDRIEFEVADEGIGIPQAEQELVFRKFYRALDPVGSNRGAPGAGVGLFIARGLVRAMGGSMRVSSVEAVGSTFVFDLPLARSGDGGDASG